MTEAPPRRIAAFAEDIVGAMDLERAVRDDASLKHFLDDLRTALRSLCR